MSTPLADRLRPQTIDDMVGQRHLLGENMPLRNIVESGYLPNLIFYGPSGTGKTTLARIIAKNTNRKLHHINGTNASTADIKAIVSELDTFAAPNGILLYLDDRACSNTLKAVKSHLLHPQLKIRIFIYTLQFFPVALYSNSNQLLLKRLFLQ